MLINEPIGYVIDGCASIWLDLGACRKLEDGFKSPFELYSVFAQGLMQELACELDMKGSTANVLASARGQQALP